MLICIRTNDVNNSGANPADCVAPSFVVLAYVKDVAEKISRVLRRENIKACNKPTSTLSHQFINILYTLDSACPLVKLKPRIFQRLPPFE